MSQTKLKEMFLLLFQERNMGMSLDPHIFKEIWFIKQMSNYEVNSKDMLDSHHVESHPFRLDISTKSTMYVLVF